MFAYEVKNIVVGHPSNSIPANGIILKSTDEETNPLPFSGFVASMTQYVSPSPDNCVLVYVAPDVVAYQQTGELKPIIGYETEYHFVQFSDEMMSDFPKDALDYFKSLKVFAYEGKELVSVDDSESLVKGIFFKAVTRPEECTRAKDGESVVAILSEEFNDETGEWVKLSPSIVEGVIVQSA